MIRKLSRSASFGLGALLLASASLVSAQYAERPADRLSRYLRELATDPTSLSALIGAGQAALEVGDGNAALGFFARADERSPRNGQVKAGLARALLVVDNPREALKMFDAARSLGVAESDLAGDRGLAYDLRGENRKAQHDYQLALTRGPNDEVTKRYALSLGITGDRDAALKLLDPLLYKRDQGAWRARAFVLAMTGDVPGASRIVHQVMPERMAITMDSFLGKLPALNAAQRAAAVHLGEMPSNVRVAQALPVLQPQPAYVAPTPTLSPTPTPQESQVRRRSTTAALVASPPPPKVVRVSVRKVKGAGLAAAPAPTPTPPPPPPPVQVAQFDDPNDYAPRVAPSFAPTPAPRLAPVRSAPLPAATQPAERGDLDAIMRDIRAAAASGSAVRTPAPVRLAQVQPRPTPTPTPKPTPVSAKAKQVADAAEPKKGKEQAPADLCKPAPKTAVRKGRASAAKEECAKPVSKDVKQAALKKKAEPKNSARVWVQVAGGANIGALPKEWAAVTSKASELKGKGPWTARNRGTNRLLAGPFKSEDEAQAAVARLRKVGIGAFRWASDDGEAVEKIGGK